MNTRLTTLLGPDFNGPWISVDPEPNSDDINTGGGVTLEEPLGKPGLDALHKERSRAEQAELENKQLKQMIEQLKGKVDPEILQEAREAQQQLQRQLEEKERAIQADRERITREADAEKTKAKQEAARERQARIELQIQTYARNVFAACDGRDGADEEGNSYFDAWYKSFGRARFGGLDESTGKPFLVDHNNVRMKEDGQDVDPVAFWNKKADNSPVVGIYFKPKGGSGSGGLVGARGIKAVRTRTVSDVLKAPRGALADEHYNS